nr:MAG TPA: hypothetical protein [Caudoviricetes sp.]
MVIIILKYENSKDEIYNLKRRDKSGTDRNSNSNNRICT